MELKCVQRWIAKGACEEQSLPGGHAEPARGSPIPQDFWVVCGTRDDTHAPTTNARHQHRPWEAMPRTKDKTEGRGQCFSKEGAAGIGCVAQLICAGRSAPCTTNPLQTPQCGRRAQSRCCGSDGKKHLSPGSRLSLFRDVPREAVNYGYKLHVRVSPQIVTLNPNFQSDGVWRWGDQVMRAERSRIGSMSLEKRPQTGPSPLRHEATARG